MSENVVMRVFGPKLADHPTIGRACPLCGKPFVAGDYTALVGDEPASEEDRAKRKRGEPYTATADEVHAACIPGPRVSTVNESRSS